MSRGRRTFWGWVAAIVVLCGYAVPMSMFCESVAHRNVETLLAEWPKHRGTVVWTEPGTRQVSPWGYKVSSYKVRFADWFGTTRYANVRGQNLGAVGTQIPVRVNRNGGAVVRGGWYGFNTNLNDPTKYYTEFWPGIAIMVIALIPGVILALIVGSVVFHNVHRFSGRLGTH